MKRHVHHAGLGVLLVLALLLTAIVPAAAKAPNDPISPGEVSKPTNLIFLPVISSIPQNRTSETVIPVEFQEQASRAAEYEQAILTLEQHIDLDSNGQIKLSVISGESLGISAEVFKTLSGSLDFVNQELKAGALHPSEIILDSRQTFADQAVIVSSRSSCQGRNGRTNHWWGYRQYADYCKTNSVIRAGASFSLFCGLLSAGICAAIGAVGTGYLLWLNSWGRGIVGSQTWAGAAWIWHQ